MANESSFGRTLRLIGRQLLAGLVLGVLGWELFGQRLLSMKYGSVASSVTCAPDVRKALAEFDSGLRFSAVGGALSFVVLVFIGKRWWRRRRATAVAPSAGNLPQKPQTGSESPPPSSASGTAP